MGEVVEKATREVEVMSLNPTDREARDFMHKNA